MITTIKSKRQGNPLRIKWGIGMLFILVLALSTRLYGQQEPQYTQFMYNKLPLNAGYTGSREVLSVRALYRNQWTGITGAPQTATLSLHSPFKKEHSAMGLYVVNDRLGKENQTWIDITYAYRVPLGKGVKLSIGLNAGILYYTHRLTELTLAQGGDPSFQQDVKRILPDVGAGLYVYHKYFYLGASVPNFIKGDLYNKGQVLPNNVSAHRTPHFFWMAGGVIPAGKVLKIRPQIMGKYIASLDQKIPHEMDFNLSLLLMDRVNLGATYRTSFQTKKTGLTNGDSFDVMLEFWATKQLMIGYAYDYTLTKLGDYNKGSHEVIVGYELSKDKKRILTPRYF